MAQLSKTEIEFFKREYPAGTRVECLSMLDPFAIFEGEKGTVRVVDDSGTIHVDWDNGRRLGLIPGLDSFRIIEETEQVCDESFPEETEQTCEETEQTCDERNLYDAEGIENLRIAIVTQAAKDYKRAYKEMRKRELYGATESVIRMHWDKCRALERWFRSDWGMLLCHDLGKAIIERLRAEVEEELKGVNADGTES